MNLWIVRIFFFALSVVIGYHVGDIKHNIIMGMGVGGALGLAVVLLEANMRRISVRGLSSAVFGLILGFIFSKLMGDVVNLLPLEEPTIYLAHLGITMTFTYLGMIIAMRGRDEFNIIIPYVRFTKQSETKDMVIIDTSVIIDGRIIDLCRTRFINGRLVVPRFVLRELQQIADSSDNLKRQRGRRGLEILHTVQKDTDIDLIIHEEDFPEPKDIDAKLVKLAKILDAQILTLDFNLNRVAELQGVRVLNINELSNALKPVFLPGEAMEVKLLKEGKEYNQAVAYLDDGTMVVVEDGRRLLGQTVRVEVTSALQTQAGRMLFAKLESNKGSGR